jgi:hypothetical protein
VEVGDVWNGVNAFVTLGAIVLAFMTGSVGVGMVRRFKDGRSRDLMARELMFGRAKKGTDPGSEGFDVIVPRLVEQVEKIGAGVAQLLKDNGHA